MNHDMNDLKPCPFCGESRAFVEDIETAQGLKWYVFCYACGATGGYKVTPAKAIEAWNSRAERTCYAKPHLNLTIDCSECGGRLDLQVRAFYCPTCGARVERKDENER